MINTLTNKPVTIRRQRGVALVMAMVILLILTILGITAMSTSTLQEKMAGGIQEMMKAFQAAESGFYSFMAETGNLDVDTPVTKPTSGYYSFGTNSGTATGVSKFIQYTNPRGGRSASPSQIYGATSMQSAVFNVTVSSTTTTLSKSTHYQGIDQIVPKNDSVE